jgi:hypothetical protein
MALFLKIEVTSLVKLAVNFFIVNKINLNRFKCFLRSTALYDYLTSILHFLFCG